MATPHDSDLLRICQEGLANVAKHAGGTAVEVLLTYSDAVLRLDICDDGRGFSPADTAPGHGLRGVRKRLAAVGGELTLTTAEGGGCTMTATIPR